MYRLWIFFWDDPFLSRLYGIYMSIKDLEILAKVHIYSKFFIYVHKILLAPQSSDLLEKWALIFLYNFHCNHILLTLKMKKGIVSECEKHKKLEVFITTLRYGSPHNEAHCMHILKEFTYVSMHRQQIQLSWIVSTFWNQVQTWQHDDKTTLRSEIGYRYT